MPTGKLHLGIRMLVVASVVALPSAALAHAVMTTPPPRDVGVSGNDGHKTGPCGGVARAGAPTQYAVGATVTVKWKETVSHEGCFQIGFSAKDDQNFTVLKQINDPVGGAGMDYTDTVTLPAGVSCPACTLVVRQLMQGGACPANADPNAAAQGTYYSCADICVGATCDAASDGGAPSDGGVAADGGKTPGTDSGVSTSPTDGGGKLVDGGDSDDDSPPNLRSGDGGGCNVSPGAASGVSFAALAGLLGLALIRRRRNRA